MPFKRFIFLSNSAAILLSILRYQTLATSSATQPGTQANTFGDIATVKARCSHRFHFSPFCVGTIQLFDKHLGPKDYRNVSHIVITNRASIHVRRITVFLCRGLCSLFDTNSRNTRTQRTQAPILTHTQTHTVTHINTNLHSLSHFLSDWDFQYWTCWQKENRKKKITKSKPKRTE